MDKKKRIQNYAPAQPEHAHFFVRDVPKTLHDKAKSEAALQGIPLREFVMEAIAEKIERRA